MNISSILKKYLFTNDNKIRIATVRAGNCFGGGDWTPERIVKDILESFTNNKPLKLRNPEATRPWQHVIEPLSGYLHLGSYALKSKYLGEPFNFGPDSKLKLS